MKTSSANRSGRVHRHREAVHDQDRSGRLHPHKRDKGRSPQRSSTMPYGMQPQMYAFCLAWLKNGQNGAAAYRVSHPQTRSHNAACAGASRLLRNAKVRAFLGEKLEAFYRAEHLSADQVLAIAGYAVTVDVADLFDDGWTLKAPKDWPIEARLAIESVDLERGKVKFVSRLGAMRMLLEACGRLRSEVQVGVDALAEAMKRDRAKHLQEQADAARRSEQPRRSA